jgi:hypothetical protein
VSLQTSPRETSFIDIPASIPSSSVTVKLEKVELRDFKCKALIGCQEMSGSDLVPGYYEGGFKVWEGAVDLVAYLLSIFKGPWEKAEGLVQHTCGAVLSACHTSQYKGEASCVLPKVGGASECQTHLQESARSLLKPEQMAECAHLKQPEQGEVTKGMATPSLACTLYDNVSLSSEVAQ